MSRQCSAANILKSDTKLVFKFFVSYHLMLSGNFKAWKVLVEGFYLGFVGALGMFLSLDLAPFDHPRHLKSELFSFVLTTPLHQSRDLSCFSGLGHVQCNEGYEVVRRNLGSLI